MQGYSKLGGETNEKQGTREIKGTGKATSERGSGVARGRRVEKGVIGERRQWECEREEKRMS